ncbi:hypothetical protein F4X33_01675, partial [Candidatus Poribacteria bacterium]|nr:hypothetical protein [Candidatus Poribacteria bacterium]
MYNWKLSAFFIIGLMLVIGVFSNAAMAVTNDGKGTVVVTSGFQNDLSNLAISSPGAADTLRAGSTHNILQFTYTAADSNGNGINMSGGRVRIPIPTDWKVSKKLIRVSDGNDLGPGTNGVVYETDAMGNLNPDIFSDEDKKAEANAKVTFEADRHITVNLGSEWSSTNNSNGTRKLVIILADVTAPIRSSLPEDNDTGDSYADDYANIRFHYSSSARNGTLTRVSPQVLVKVGNILGDRDLSDGDPNDPSDLPDGQPDGDATRDPLIREFKVEPGRVFPGDKNIPVRIVFEAPGPMYGSELDITIPSALQTDPFDTSAITGRTISISKGGANIGGSTISGNTLTIPINTINTGQRITVSYRIPMVPVDGAAGHVTAQTEIGSETAANAKVTGGVVSAIAGSGRMDIVPSFVNAGSTRRRISLTYTAYTKLENVDIEIVPDGIVRDTDRPLQKNNSGKYGYVYGDVSSTKLTVTNDLITWQDITLNKNKTFKTYIGTGTSSASRVDITDAVGNYNWIVRVGPTGTALSSDHELRNDPTTDVDERPVLSVGKISADAVKFRAEPNIFHAASRATITFTFTANTTPIRDGSVSLTIPSDLGSPPTTAKDTAGRVTVESEGTLETNQRLVSGRRVTVAIKRLDIGQSVMIKYGTDVDDKESEKAVLHHAADEAVTVSGSFRTSLGNRSVNATIRLNNVVDGSGSATLSPTSIAAGSNNQAIEVIFTAAGTMNGGKVNLEIPSDWGTLQTDPTRRNYVTVRGSAVSSLDVRSLSAEATIRTLGKGGSFRFVLGGGTSSANNGVEVQDNIGIAQFTIKSDGDGDGVFEPVESDLKYEGREKTRNPKKLGKVYADAPGVLQIEVGGALDGTGTATVDIAEVRAAADDVQLVFTYTPTQTIADGALRFTVPSGWSKPQVDELGSPGYTEMEGLGLGTATDDDRFSVTVPIYSLDKTQSIRIIYGATHTGRAVASATTGTDTFRIEVKGHEGGSFKAIRSQPTVRVTGQGSGKGRATITVRAVGGDTNLYAGDTGRALTITYTAAGQLVAGKVRLTIPPDWSAPTRSTVTVRPSTSIRYDGQMVIVEGVNLSANGTLTFVYTGDVQPTVGTDVKFNVEVHSGRPEDSYEEVSGANTALTVEIREARRGSGSGTVTPTRVSPGDTGVNLTFTYTAVGEISAPREFRVQVPASWTAPSGAATSSDNKGTYTVMHRHAGIETLTSIEKLAPIGRDMVARVRLGGLEVEAGDQIIFTYENADAPTTTEVSTFRILFDGRQIQDRTQVGVGTSVPVPDPTPPPD